MLKLQQEKRNILVIKHYFVEVKVLLSIPLQILTQLEESDGVATSEHSISSGQSMDPSIDDQPVKSSIKTSHMLKGVDICSIWDGITDHAALARINLLVCGNLKEK